MVVIARSLARRVFGEEEAVGRVLSVNFEEFRVAGVVEDASYLLDRIYAQIWYPYTYNKDWELGELRNAERNPGLGSFYCYALVKEGASLREAQERLRERFRAYGHSLGEGRTFTAHGAPDLHWESVFRYYSGVDLDLAGELTRYAIIIFFLLLVPAVSLLGMVDSRMERRLAGAGPPAFGARNVAGAGLGREPVVYRAGRIGGVAVLLPRGRGDALVGV